jgi:hypothetical protein
MRIVLGCLLATICFACESGRAADPGQGGSGSGGASATGGVVVGGTGAGGASATGGVVTGRDAGLDEDAATSPADVDAAAYACPLTDLYCDYRYELDSHGCLVCLPLPEDAGSGSGLDSPKVAVVSGANDLAMAARCTSTGGTVTLQYCCSSVGSFPDRCFHSGFCSCGASDSQYSLDCSCPVGRCYYPSGGCSLP